MINHQDLSLYVLPNGGNFNPKNNIRTPEIISSLEGTYPLDCLYSNFTNFHVTYELIGWICLNYTFTVLM